MYTDFCCTIKVYSTVDVFTLYLLNEKIQWQYFQCVILVFTVAYKIN